jgi:hypothetical protein
MLEMKDFASALAHDVLHNDFDSLPSEDRALGIDSRQGEMQSLMLSLGGGGGITTVRSSSRETTDLQLMRAASTAGAGSELLASATRESEIAKHGELEHTQGKEKDCIEACGKRKQCSIPNCSKKSGWQCKVCEAPLCQGEGGCVSEHQSQVRKNMKENE